LADDSTPDFHERKDVNTRALVDAVARIVEAKFEERLKAEMESVKKGFISWNGAVFWLAALGVAMAGGAWAVMEKNDKTIAARVAPIEVRQDRAEARQDRTDGLMLSGFQDVNRKQDTNHAEAMSAIRSLAQPRVERTRRRSHVTQPDMNGGDSRGGP
jgi:hypothetical protein